MKTRRVLRYTCDHCGKGMFKRPAMERHERLCFHNPKRECGGCDFHGGLNDHDMAAMIQAMNEGGIEAVRPIAENCPACICAALVQARKQAHRAGDDALQSFLWIDQNFDYKAEWAKFRTAVADSRPEDFYY